VHDPHVLQYPGVTIESDILKVVRDADVVTIMTGHSDYFQLDPALLKKEMGQESPVIIDGRNVVDADRYINEGFVYKGIGRGDKNDHTIV